MPTNEYIFKNRLTRRDFLTLAGVAAAGFAVPGCATYNHASDKPAVRIGNGHHTYTLD